MTDNGRISRLREKTLTAEYNLDEFKYYFYKALADKPLDYDSYAEAYETAMKSTGVYIDPDEIIVGRYGNSMTDSQKKEWEEKYLDAVEELYLKTNGGQNSHMAIDYELLLTKGITGVADKIDAKLKECKAENVPFLKACKRCLFAVGELSVRYAEALEGLAEGETGEKKETLLMMSKVCRRVPLKPASSFIEAVQSVHFMTYALSLDPLRKWHQQFQLGHPDRYLYPYYKKDIESGAITENEAQLILDLLGILINMRVPSGLSSGYMVGGIDRSGKTVSNELTDMLMQVIEDVKLVYPSVGLCYSDEEHDKHLEKACRILAGGRSHPAIFNDKVITKGLMDYGVPEAQAHEYIHSTCVEITPCATSNAWVASPYTNMAQLLLDVMDKEHESFDALLKALFDKLDSIIEKNYHMENGLRRTRAENSMLPLLSCFVGDCIENETDIEKGGAKYNWVLPSFVGMANLVDSLYAIKKTVYDEKQMTLMQLKEITDSNFEGNEALRLKLLKDIPKYGNDIDDVDGYFGIITAHIVDECKKYKGLYENGNTIPSVFCWVMHERFGRQTGATPDGRSAGFPLGDGSGPCQGREMKGPTASILSSTKWDHSPLVGGVAVNMKFSKSSLGASSVDVMQTLVKTYLMRGGFEMQINVVDKAVLEAAMQEPEKYADLVVRIGGYSDYFTRLSPAMQSEVILRTSHNI